MVNKRGIFILDSYALLAFLEGEQGADKVKQVLGKAEKGQLEIYISMINLGEVVYIIERERNLMKAQEVLALLEQLPIEIVQVDREMVLNAAHIKANYPVSYADAFAVALAQLKGGVVLTDDPEFEVVKGIVDVEGLS